MIITFVSVFTLEVSTRSIRDLKSHDLVVVVVWFGDPCESPGALLLKAAPVT